MFLGWLLSDIFCCRSTRCSWQGNLCHLWIFRQHDLYLEFWEAHLHRYKVCGVCEEVGSCNSLTWAIPLQSSQCSASSRDPNKWALNSKCTLITPNSLIIISEATHILFGPFIFSLSGTMFYKYLFIEINFLSINSMVCKLGAGT